MGQSRSRQINETTNNLLNKNITNILNTTENQVTNSFEAGQSVRLIATNGSTVNCGGDLIMKNLSGPIDVNLATTINNENSTELKTLLKNNASNVVDQQEKTFAEMGGLLGTNMSRDQRNKISNTISNIIETNVTNETLNEAVNAFQFNQELGIELTDGSTLNVVGDCNLTNESSGVQFQAQNIIGNVVKIVAENEAFTEVMNDVKQSQELELEGLSGLVDSIGDAAAGILRAATGPMIAFIVAGVVCFALMVYFLFSSGGNADDLKAILNNPSASSADKASASQKMSKLGFVAKMGKLKWIFLGLMGLITLAIIGMMIWNIVAYFQAKDHPEEVLKEEYPDCSEEIDMVIPVLKELDELDLEFEQATTQAEKEAIIARKNDVLIENEIILNQYNDCLNEKYDAGIKLEVETSEGFAHLTLPAGSYRNYYTLRGYETPKPQFRSWW